MGTNQVWLTDEEQAKMTYVQEQKNKGKPFEEQQKVNQILQEWIRERLEGCDVPSQLEEKHVLHEEG